MPYQITDDHVLGARAIMAPQYRNLSDQDIRNYLYQQTAGLSAEDAEGFFDSLQSFAKSAGKYALQAVPTVAPILGTAAGTLIGGPVGAQIGGAIGNTAGQFASNISKGQSAGQAIKGAAGSGLGGLVGSFTGGGGGVSGLGGLLSSFGGGGSAGGAASGLGGILSSFTGGGGAKPAASVLNNFLNNPQVTGSIGSLLMGGLGQKSVPVKAGGQSFNFNPAQILSALGTLAQQAALEAAEDAEDTGYVYLQNPDGSFAVDPNNPEHRAARIYQLLQQQSRENRYYVPEPVATRPQRRTLEGWFEDAGWMVN